MGQSRQGIGRLVNLMVNDGLLDNPQHLKLKFYTLTYKAKRVRRAAYKRYVKLSNQ